MATVERLEGNQAKLTIEVSKEVFAQAIQQAYIKNVKRYQVPGFRKGKAPRRVIESMYGEGAFYEDAFEAVYGDAYTAAVEESGLVPVDNPQIDIETISEQEGVVFTAVVTLKPEVKLGAYKGIEIEKQAYTVGDAEVEKALQQEQEKAVRYLDVDRPVQDGDSIILDYSGSVNGVKFDGGTAEDQTLVIGSGTFIPGFEEQLIGMNAGEEKEINVTFPENYQPDLQGKDAVFAVKIKSVRERQLPTLDDEFAKDISEFDTLEELRADRRRQLQDYADVQAQNVMDDDALRQAADNAEIDIPDCMVERQIDMVMQDLAYQLSMSGLSMEDYMKFSGSDMEAMRAEYRDEALNQVRTSLVLEAIVKEEGIEATEEDLNEELASYAEQSKKTVEEVKQAFSERELDYFRDRILERKAMKVITDNAVLVEKKEPKKVAGPAASAGTEAEAAESTPEA